jgi:hypothetical protein
MELCERFPQRSARPARFFWHALAERSYSVVAGLTFRQCERHMQFARKFAMLITALFGFVVSFRGEPLEFSGYLKSEAGSRILITDLGDGIRSGWLNIGGSFRGFTLINFDPEHGFVSLTKETQTLQLPLKESKTGDVMGILLRDKTISASDDGELFIGDFAVDLGTLTELLRQLAETQPEDVIRLTVQWTSPATPLTAELLRARMARLEQVVKNLGDLRESGKRPFLQIKLPDRLQWRFDAP